MTKQAKRVVSFIKGLAILDRHYKSFTNLDLFHNSSDLQANAWARKDKWKQQTIVVAHPKLMTLQILAHEYAHFIQAVATDAAWGNIALTPQEDWHREDFFEAYEETCGVLGIYSYINTTEKCRVYVDYLVSKRR